MDVYGLAGLQSLIGVQGLILGPRLFVPKLKKWQFFHKPPQYGNLWTHLDPNYELTWNTEDIEGVWRFLLSLMEPLQYNCLWTPLDPKTFSNF